MTVYLPVPFMPSAGSGVLDLKTILTTGKRYSLEYFIVEQDMVANSDIALKKRYDYVAGL